MRPGIKNQVNLFLLHSPFTIFVANENTDETNIVFWYRFVLCSLSNGAGHAERIHIDAR